MVLRHFPYKFNFDEDKEKYKNDIENKYSDIKVIQQSNHYKMSNRMEKNYHLSNKKALY